MKQFHEIQFPSDIAYGATGGPEFFTDIVLSSSGYEHRNINWLHPRHRYNLAPAIKNKQQLEQVINFFWVCQGKAIGFRFKDWTDFQLNDQLVAIADGKTVSYQILKTYRLGETIATRKISKPVQNTIKIRVENQEVIADVDYLTGKFLLKESPSKGSKIFITGEFDVPVRFDTDHLINRLENYQAYSHLEIPLIEIKD